MQVSVLTVPYDPATGRFDEAELRAFQAEREVLAITEQFFVHDGRPAWSLVLRWRPRGDADTRPAVDAPKAPTPSKRTNADWRATLAAEQTALYDALRRWRNQRARRDGKPAYVYLTNRMMAEIARRRPRTRAALAEVQGVLRAALARRVFDDELRRLIDVFIDHGAPGCAAGRGLPVGNLTSQHFGNFYLGRLDRFIKQTLRVKGYLRYMDDLTLLADDKPTLWRWRDAIAAFAEEALRLELKAEATRVAPVADGVPFLGFRVFPGLVRLGPKQARRWRSAMGGVRRGLDSGALTEDDAARITAGLLGWAAHADTDRFVRSYSARHHSAGEGR